MTYALLCLPFLALALVAGWLLSRDRRGHWAAVGITIAALFVLTAVFDSIMIGLDLFTYEESLILGARIGLAPVEDFAYPLATALGLPALWVALTRKDAVPVGELLRRGFVVSRPVSWINTAYPFAVAMLLVTREVDWLLVVGTLFFLIPYNLAMYGINDVFDYESDIVNPRKGGIEGALLPLRFHRPLLWLVAATCAPFLLVLFVAGDWTARTALAISCFAVVAYSARGLRFKERPVLDSITSSTHFVSPAVVGFALAGAEFTTPMLLTLGAFFLWGMAAHAFGAVQDIVPDREGGISSIATVFGARATVRIALGLWLLAGLLMLATPWPGPLAAIVAVPYLINCGVWFNVTDQTAERTNASWRRFIWLNYFSGFLVTLLIIWHWRLTS